MCRHRPYGKESNGNIAFVGFLMQESVSILKGTVRNPYVKYNIKLKNQQKSPGNQ